MLKLARRAAVLLAAAGFLAVGPPATAAPAARASAASTAAARPVAARAAVTAPARGVAGHAAAAAGPTRIRARGADLVNVSAGHLNRQIKVTRAIPAYIRRHPDASSAGLRAGDVLTARQLLEAMLLPSGCDAALALAKAYGPGRAAFVHEMNTTARRLGMRRTHFSNFDGMPLPTEHSTYSTPGDLITLGQAA